MKIEFRWEKIHESPDGCNITYRAKVMNGWLVNSYVIVENTPSECMVFVPDPKHQWEIEIDNEG